MKRLELVRVRVCERCGRGGAELRGPGDERIVVSLDAVRTQQLRAARPDAHTLTEVVLQQLRASGLEPSEVVLDVIDGRIYALLSLVGGGEPGVVDCTADEGVAIAVRGDLALYATDEAIAHAAARAGKPAHARGPGGDTIH